MSQDFENKAFGHSGCLHKQLLSERSQQNPIVDLYGLFQIVKNAFFNLISQSQRTETSFTGELFLTFSFFKQLLPLYR